MRYALLFFYVFVLWFLHPMKCYSQSIDSVGIKVSGYADVYYAYYTDSVGEGNYQKFPSVAPRSNQLGLNTALVTVQYDRRNVRGLVTLHFGDISRGAWSTTYPNIMEAHAGVKLCNKIWVDAGFFRTHTGAEGLLPKENFTSSVSVSTFAEPYYECGLRINYNPSDKLALSFYILNGYNIYEDNNQKKSIGLLASYAFDEKGNVGYTNYVGDDTPTAADSISHLRIFQNLFFNYQFGKLKMQIGIDNCVQQHSDFKNANQDAIMFSGVLSFKYLFSSKFALYSRGEYFNDPQGMMLGTITDRTNKVTGYKLWGVTAGAELKPTENTLIRLEERQLVADRDQEIFNWNGNIRKSRLEILMTLGISF